jgi:transposase
MKIMETVGIDISKLTFEARVHTSQAYQAFDNETKGYQDLVSWAYKNSSFSKEEIVFVFEHTGLYSHQLSVYLSSRKIPFFMVPGLEIKRSLGMARGKDDKKDATKIAQYAYRLRDEIVPSQLATEEVMNLKRLLSLRERLVKQRAGYKASLKEQKRVLPRKTNEVLLSTQEKMIRYLSKQIDIVEEQMKGIIKENESMSRNFKLLNTIKGVGPQTALFMIAYTANFTKFRDSRKFASYTGIAPFPNTSGTSIRGRNKVSNLANKKIKSLLDLCAKSSIQYNLEMKKYYEQRIDIGKNKMSTINIIRNKIVSRMFAVVKRNEPYVNLMKYAA